MLSKKGYLLFIVLISLINPGLSQNLSLFDINADAYPNVKAKFYAFDGASKQLINLTRSDVVIAENGNPQNVVRVTNPEYEVPKASSIILTVDISGSMVGGNMEIAKLATRTLVQLIALDHSECAITSFDNSSYINCDFSNDPSRLLKASDQLKANGGTNYDEAFNNNLTGALEIAKNGAYKKAIIFLTDGLGSANQEQIIQQAKSLGVTIYCVTIGMPAPRVLREISTQTGGYYYENVNTKEEAKKVYQRIFFELQDLKPSTVEWISNPDCQIFKSISFQIPSSKLIDNSGLYKIGYKSTSRLSANPANFKFESAHPGKDNDTTIVLGAINSDFTLLSATSNHTAFNIINVNFPLKIPSGQSLPITVRYNSAIRGYESAIISFSTDQCSPTIIHVNNGWSNKAEIPIKLEHPNGGEVFFAGSDTTITWSGVFPSEEIKLELSSDSARSWRNIATNAKSLKYEWHVPDRVGDNMLVRGSINIGSKKRGLENLYVRDDKERGVYKMSSDNSKLLWENSNKTFILDFMTGEFIGLIDFVKFNEDSPLYWHGSFFSEDGSKIYMHRDEEPLQVYSTLDYKLIAQLPKVEIRDGGYYNEGATQYLRQTGNEVKIVELETGKVIKEMAIPQGWASTYRDNLVAVIKMSDGICEVWDINTESKIASFDTDLQAATGIITTNKKYLITKSVRPGNYPRQGKFTVFDIENEKELYSWTTPDERDAIMDVAGDVMLRTIDDVHQIMEIATGKVIAVVPFSGRYGSISRDGRFVIIYDFHKIVMKMFMLQGSGTGSDISDRVFSIVAPRLVAKEVGFGDVRLGDIKEQIFSSFLKNPQNIDVEVDSIYLDGGDSNAFSIVSGQSTFKIKRLEFESVEFRFTPTKIGPHETNIVIQTRFEKIKVPLKGEGVERRIALMDKTINLGKVYVGDTKDSVVTSVIQNISTSTISINSVSIAGPDYDQFELLSNSRFKLKKNASIDLHILFKPRMIGKTSTRIQYQVDGETGENTLRVFAEGVARPLLEQDVRADSLDSFALLLTRITPGETVRLDNVLFVQSKAELLAGSHKDLDALYLYLINNTEYKIELAGHTDNQGNPRANQQLSEERVEAIKEYFIQKGINKRRISGRGYGDTKPVASNAREETRRLNRRVEFKIVE